MLHFFLYRRPHRVARRQKGRDPARDYRFHGVNIQVVAMAASAGMCEFYSHRHPFWVPDLALCSVIHVAPGSLSLTDPLV